MDREKINESSLDLHLELIKKRKPIAPRKSFKGSVMARIKAAESLNDDVSPFLEAMKNHKAKEVPPNFKSQVMARIKASESADNVDLFLETQKVNKNRRVPANFKKDVMERIHSYEENKSKVISPFQNSDTSIYKRFLAAASIAAAIALIVSFWAFSNYTPEVADFMATDFLNIGLY